MNGKRHSQKHTHNRFTNQEMGKSREQGTGEVVQLGPEKGNWQKLSGQKCECVRLLGAELRMVFMFFSHLISFSYNVYILFIKNNDSNKVTSMADFSKNEFFFLDLLSPLIFKKLSNINILTNYKWRQIMKVS